MSLWEGALAKSLSQKWHWMCQCEHSIQRNDDVERNLLPVSAEILTGTNLDHCHHRAICLDVAHEPRQDLLMKWYFNFLADVSQPAPPRTFTMVKTWRVKRDLLYNYKLPWFILCFAAAEQIPHVTIICSWACRKISALSVSGSSISRVLCLSSLVEFRPWPTLSGTWRKQRIMLWIMSLLKSYMAESA